jgi:hypothetical protein
MPLHVPLPCENVSLHGRRVQGGGEQDEGCQKGGRMEHTHTFGLGCSFLRKNPMLGYSHIWRRALEYELLAAIKVSARPFLKFCFLLRQHLLGAG